MAGVLRDGESFLENHESAVGRETPQARLRPVSKGRPGFGQVSFSGGFFTQTKHRKNSRIAVLPTDRHVLCNRQKSSEFHHILSEAA
jgi:hypothetical protein